jgi:lipoate-protein ligase A
MKIEKYHFDDDLIAATCLDNQPRFQVYQPYNIMVVIGKGSDPDVELKVQACLEDEVPLYHRAGGGCAVVLEPGNIIVSAVMPSKGIVNITQYFHDYCDWLIQGLSRIGLTNVYREGLSDLVIDNRKIAGACIWNSKDIVYYSASLLVEPQIELMEKYLKHPPREPKYRQGRSHRDFVGQLKPLLSNRTVEDVVSELQDKLAIGAVKCPHLTA